ncbi:MAG: hypothetical protein HYW51_02355 [Candidatus Doudnabacteria bacterium]|nr:hypothetical protein [Candidatus Doudnabacteria bacterium]
MALNLTVRKIYLYLFAVVGLVLMITGSVSLIDLGLKTFVFKQADNYPIYVDRFAAPTKEGTQEELTEEEIAAKEAKEEERQRQQRTSDRQRQASNAVAQLIVGLPLFVYHWRLIQKEGQV